MQSVFWVSLQITREFDRIVKKDGSLLRFEQAWTHKWAPAVLKLAETEGLSIADEDDPFHGLDEMPEGIEFLSAFVSCMHAHPNNFPLPELVNRQAYKMLIRLIVPQRKARSDPQRYLLIAVKVCGYICNVRFFLHAEMLLLCRKEHLCRRLFPLQHILSSSS